MIYWPSRVLIKMILINPEPETLIDYFNKDSKNE